MRWLLEEEGVAVDTANKDGRTALMWACKNGEERVAAYLVHEGGADVRGLLARGSHTVDLAGERRSRRSPLTPADPVPAQRA